MTDAVARLTSALEGRYAIERELGAGGMATVYLAHDVKHDRKVALKVLRPELASILGAERFLTEIKTTANLQHPHILALHDSGEADGVVFYVMPYIEGESLRDRLQREHQLPVDEAVRIAREVAGALDYAHRHSVVHRDIKPENILLHEGQALVADFGIALAASRSDGGSRMTETGMSLGTPHYMSPEQAMGEREITAKADIYALGCVMYEMLAGEPPFTGPTAQAIVARVMTEQPRSLTIQRRTIPPNVEAAVSRALEKLPADRFATAAEFATALANPGFTTAVVAATGTAAGSRRDWRMRAAVPLAIATLAFAAVAAWLGLRPAPAAPVHRYGVSLPASQAPLPDRRFVISPDGARFVFVGPGPAGSQLWVKERARSDATPLAGTVGVGGFALSPDGTWLAFMQSGLLKKLPILGGAAITLADSVGAAQGLTWLDDGSIVYIGPRSNQLRRVRDVGGAWTSVWHSDTGIIRFPEGLPGGRGVLFDRCLGAACRLAHDLWVVDLRSSESHVVQPGAARGVYAPTGHVIYVREDGGMFALPFSVHSLRPTGASVPVLDSVAVVNGAIPLMDLSNEGTLLVRPGSGISSRASYQMVWVDRAGRQSLVDSSWQFRHVVTGGNAGWALSPNSRRLAIGEATEAGDDIWIKQLPRGPRSRLTFDSSAEYRPRWSPDGLSVDYVGLRGPAAAIYRKRADGTGTEQLVAQLGVNIHEVARTRDEKWLVLRTGGTVGQVGARDILVRHIGVDSVPRPLLASPAFDEAAIALSPDGRWIAYETDETGRTEVYVRPFPNVDGGKWQVSTGGGVSPLWAKSGRELFFVDGGQNVVTAPVLPGPTFRLGERRTLFHLSDDVYLPANEHYATWDVAADGRFLMARRTRMDLGQAAPLIVVENWFTELNQKLGRK
ncbi:MAG: protein kinase [Gemmatimonadales bacterium]